MHMIIPSYPFLDHSHTKQSGFEVSAVYPDTVEEWHLQKDRLLEYITQGDLEKCVQHYQKYCNNSTLQNLSKIYIRYPGNSIRSCKNSLITLNSLCSHAARDGGVPAFTVNFTFSKYTIKTENALSKDFLTYTVLPVMLGDYCLLVKNYSISCCSCLIREVTNHILKHLPSSLSVNQLADIFNITPSSLSGRFKRETGFGLSDFINRHRVMLAQYYMEHGCHNIADIAYFTGFSDSNYFCRIFKKLTAITPTQYIEHVKNPDMLI